VEAHFKGPASVVEEMVMRLKEGPPASRVDEVEELDSGDPIEADAFEILF
jgi:acylphosphatase